MKSVCNIRPTTTSAYKPGNVLYITGPVGQDMAEPLASTTAAQKPPCIFSKPSSDCYVKTRPEKDRFKFMRFSFITHLTETWGLMCSVSCLAAWLGIDFNSKLNLLGADMTNNDMSCELCLKISLKYCLDIVTTTHDC